MCNMLTNCVAPIIVALWLLSDGGRCADTREGGLWTQADEYYVRTVCSADDCHGEAGEMLQVPGAIACVCRWKEVKLWRWYGVRPRFLYTRPRGPVASPSRRALRHQPSNAAATHVHVFKCLRWSCPGVGCVRFFSGPNPPSYNTRACSHDLRKTQFFATIVIHCTHDVVIKRFVTYLVRTYQWVVTVINTYCAHCCSP